MTIRARLLIILLITALMPLAVTSMAHQVSIWLARSRLATHAREALDSNARQGLKEQLEGHVEFIKRDRQLAQALLRRQAREIELALAAPAYADKSDCNDSTFGYDSSLATASSLYHPLFSDANDPNTAALGIDYQRQGYFIADRADPAEAMQLLLRLSPMTQVYNEIYKQAPKGTLWLSTSLGNGLISRYPAGGSLSALFSRRLRRPSTELGPRTLAAEGGSAEQGKRPGPGDSARGQDGPGTRSRGRRMPGRIPVLVDQSTGQVMVVMTERIHAADGSRAGVTAMTRTISEFFENMALPERWGTDTERMIVRVDPNATSDQLARILFHSKLDKTAPTRSRRVVPGILESDDDALYQAMISDMLAETPRVRKMTFRGRPCLWAYQATGVTGIAALLIVPYTHVTELAETMERTLIRESLFWLQMTTVVLVLATVYAIVLALRKARSLTDPIGTLVDASRQLASGDFEASVQIHSGDELEHLGKVFNDIGPKLREYGTLKLSLELARAVQQNLLPGHTPALSNFELTGRCLYCDETGGDYYDFIDLPEVKSGTVGVVVGDVSGHGIGAALLMASIRGVTHAEAKYYADHPAQMLARTNRQVVQDTDDERFVTLFYGLLEDQTRSCTWASAGHEPALWYHSGDRRIEELPNTGMPLGVMEKAEFKQIGPIHLEPEDILIIGTDGIWEAQNDQGEFFGKERFLDVIKDKYHLAADDLADLLMDHITGFIGLAARTDDITLVLIKAR
jgi:phosphoserine phosphatase RsbU/P